MYFKGSQPNIKQSAEQLAMFIDTVRELFQHLTDSELLVRPKPGKWSKKEILGHLVDSAINNLKRFTEIQFLPSPYQLRPYRQEELVVVNQYQHLPLEHLLMLWKMLNQQILYVIENVPSEKLNLTWQVENENDLYHLDFLIADYVAHLGHHIDQVK
ncbi:MAG: DinB family protein [Chitinophagaceae bacterium]|nr:MAG: DinB family protein [Chitinophagaceae bacterium]